MANYCILNVQREPNTDMNDWIMHVPDIKVHGANMGPIWGRQDPGGPHVGPINFPIWGRAHEIISK